MSVASEIQLLLAHLPQPRRVIGVTGTAGKSTVTAMIGHILADQIGEDHVLVGGNLGGSLLDRVTKVDVEDWVVLELSSFMLESMKEDRWSPHVAVVTNLTPNHLDRHGTMEAYAAAKQLLLENQRPDDFAVLGPGLDHEFRCHAGSIHLIEAAPQPPLSLMIPGTFNQINAAMAIQASVCVGMDRNKAVAAASRFPGLPHRMQLVGQWQGVRYYNDSKSTTPTAATLAIRELVSPSQGDNGGVHVILGGFDKGNGLSELACLAGRCCAGVYTIGATGDAIATAAQKALPPRDQDRIVRCGTLDQAVSTIQHRARSGDLVLLSPGCASWDQFENYEKRGQAFIDAVERYRTSTGMPRYADSG